MKEIKLPIVKDIEAKFLDRVVSLVGYGSYSFNRPHDNSDVDLCLLLDTRKRQDLVNVRNIVASNNSHIDITIHYLDEIELRGWDNFHHGTHGVFFLHHLANSIVLSGDDIFSRKSVQVPVGRYKDSLVSQIYQYIDRIQIQLMHDTSMSVDFFRKYLTRTMIDMMLLEFELSYREVNTNSAVDLMNNFISTSAIFSDSSKEFHEKIMKQDADLDDISTSLQYIVADFQKQLKRLVQNEQQ